MGSVTGPLPVVAAGPPALPEPPVDGPEPPVAAGPLPPVVAGALPAVPLGPLPPVDELPPAELPPVPGMAEEPATFEPGLPAEGCDTDPADPPGVCVALSVPQPDHNAKAANEHTNELAERIIELRIAMGHLAPAHEVRKGRMTILSRRHHSGDVNMR